MMKGVYIEISSPHPISELTSRLKGVTAKKLTYTTNTAGLKYVGSIESNSAKIRDAYASHRSLSPTYFIEFIQKDNHTIVLISNNQFEMNSIPDGILKGILIPMGVIFLILGIVKYRDPVALIMGVVLGFLAISFPLLFNAKKSTSKSLGEDLEVKWLADFFNGTILASKPSVNDVS